MRRALRYALVGIFALTGCNALLDVKDIYLDGDAGTADGGGDGPATTTEGGATDGGKSEGGPCGDTSADPNNCGRCGRDCLGGGCEAGTCAPITLLNNLASPGGLAVGATDVYVTAYGSGTVVSVGKDGGGARPLATGQTSARGVALSGTTLFWGDEDFPFDDAGSLGGIWSCTLPACTTVKLLAPGDFASHPTVHGTTLFFGAMNSDQIFRVPVTGGAAVPIANVHHPFGIAVDDNYAYFTSGQTSFLRALADGGGVGKEEAIGASNDKSGFVALDSTRVYWTYSEDNLTGHVLSALKDGTNVLSYGSAADDFAPVGVAVDDTNVYWSTAGTVSDAGDPNGDGKILWCPKAGCGAAPGVLATGNLFGGPMEVDDVAVYWVEIGADGRPAGRVRKVRKP